MRCGGQGWYRGVSVSCGGEKSDAVILHDIKDLKAAEKESRTGELPAFKSAP